MAETWFALRCQTCGTNHVNDGVADHEAYFNCCRGKLMDDNHQTVPTHEDGLTPVDPSSVNGKLPTVPEMLRECASTYEQRNAMYGDTYKRFGHVLSAIFPDGLTIKGVDDWNRLGCFILKMGKVTRYAANYTRGGHDDSLLDDAVYTTMLRELDKAIDEIPF